MLHVLLFESIFLLSINISHISQNYALHTINIDKNSHKVYRDRHVLITKMHVIVIICLLSFLERKKKSCFIKI